MQLGVHGERGHSNFMHKLFQTRYATQFHRLRQRAVCPQTTVTNADIDVVTQRASTLQFFRWQLLDRTIGYAAQVQTLRRDLVEMYFHRLTLRHSLAKFPIE